LPILIVGIPRSGTTWVGEILSSDRNISYIFEPDNEKNSALAGWYKRGRHRFPCLERNTKDPQLLEFWRRVFYGEWNFVSIDRALSSRILYNRCSAERSVGEKTGLVYIDKHFRDVECSGIKRRFDINFALEHLSQIACRVRFFGHNRLNRLVKSVHITLSLEWMERNFNPQIVLVVRNPFSLYATYTRMSMPDACRNILSMPDVRNKLRRIGIEDLGNVKNYNDAVAQQICGMLKIISYEATLLKNVEIVSHDRLCLQPCEAFARIFSKLGLEWTTRQAERLAKLNNAGSGFKPSRISANEPFKWHRELNGKEKQRIEYFVDVFELDSFLEEQVMLDGNS